MLRLPPNTRPPIFLGINRASPQAKDLRGWWPVQLSRGQAKLRDQSGHGNHGTLTSMDVTDDYVATERGYVLNFDGAGLVNLGDADVWSIHQSGDKSTISLWAYPTTNNVDHLVSKSTEYSLTLRNGVSTPFIRFDMWGDNSGAADEIVTLNQWHHIAVSWTAGSGGTIYLNGASYKTFSTTDTSSNTAIKLVIGAREDENNLGTFAEHFEGWLDDVRIYDRALSPPEILDIYRRPYDLWLQQQRGPVPEQAAAPPAGDTSQLTLLGVG